MRTLGKRVWGNPPRVRIPHPPQERETVSRDRFALKNNGFLGIVFFRKVRGRRDIRTFRENGISRTDILSYMSTLTTLSIWCGILVGPFFIAVFLIEGLLRSGYQPLRQPVSALAIGPRGWIQRTNFYVTGLLALLYAFGLHGALAVYGSSWWLPALVAVFGLGLIGAGIFVTDITGLAWPSRAERTRSRSGRYGNCGRGRP